MTTSRILAAGLMLAACGMASDHTRAVLQPGTLAEPWLTGGPNCLTVPNWQVHEYNEDFYILRESGCINAEKPFLYLMFGENKALLEDTGVASAADKSIIPTAPVVMDLMARWAKRKHHAPVSLIVIHSHAHGDHTATTGDCTIAERCGHVGCHQGSYPRRRGEQSRACQAHVMNIAEIARQPCQEEEKAPVAAKIGCYDCPNTHHPKQPPKRVT